MLQRRYPDTPLTWGEPLRRRHKGAGRRLSSFGTASFPVRRFWPMLYYLLIFFSFSLQQLLLGTEKIRSSPDKDKTNIWYWSGSVVIWLWMYDFSAV
ncbi:MAG: hypothetical protein LBL90_06270 [Prevotellaceae bacterium]|nr:hypothetical protein [Prevotellaceae bacterium]